MELLLSSTQNKISFSPQSYQRSAVLETVQVVEPDCNPYSSAIAVKYFTRSLHYRLLESMHCRQQAALHFLMLSLQALKTFPTGDRKSPAAQNFTNKHTIQNIYSIAISNTLTYLLR